MTVTASASLLRPTRVQVIAGGGVILAALLSFLAPLPAEDAWVRFVALAVGALLLLLRLPSRATDVQVRATERGIALHGDGTSRNLAGEDVLELKLSPAGVDVTVMDLTLRDRSTCALRMASADAAAVARVLGPRRVRFHLFASVWLRALVWFAALGGFVALFPEAWNLPPLLMFPLAWLTGYLRRTLVIGADGLTLGGIGRTRFIPFTAISAVTSRPYRKLFAASGAASNLPVAPITFAAPPDEMVESVVELRSGEELRLRTSEGPTPGAGAGQKGRAMHAHLVDALAQARRVNAVGPEVAEVLAPGARSAGAWLRAIDALVGDRAGGGGYRGSRVSNDALTDLARDPGADDGSRLGAAAALVRTGDEGLRVRVRVVAEGCARPELREAMLAVADAENDEGAEAALARRVSRR